MKADLHMHSTISDGAMTIHQLRDYGKLIGLDYMAITDHDTTKNFSLVEQVFEGSGITPLKGLEISAYDYKRDKKAHILGYFIKDLETMEYFLQPLIAAREAAAKEMVATIQKEGYPITWNLVKSKAKDATNVYKQHIMDVLMDLGYAETLKGRLYNELFSKEHDGKQGVAYREFNYFDAGQAVEKILECGGVSVLAHPFGYKNHELIPELIARGLMGLEGNHPSHSQEERAAIENLCKQHQLIMTGGSDFHGRFEGHINPLGNALTSQDNLVKLLNYQ